MKKNKAVRSLAQVGASQQIVEKANSNKFQDRPFEQVKGRKYPQVSYTVTAEDKELIIEWAVMMSSKLKRIVKPSEILRAVIRLAKCHLKELSID